MDFIGGDEKPIRSCFVLGRCTQADLPRERESVYAKKMLANIAQAKTACVSSSYPKSRNKLPARGVDLCHNLLNLEVFQFIGQFLFGKFAQGSFSIFIANKSTEV